MEKYETKKLYIVKPSIVIDDNTIYYEKLKLGKHIVTLKNNSKNIDIVTSTKCNFFYKSLFSNNTYFDGIGFHCIEGDYHVGVYKNDIMLLAKYLYEQKVSDTKWTKELERYIITLKPYYDYDELRKIIEEIKLSTNDDEKTEIKTLTNTYTI